MRVTVCELPNGPGELEDAWQRLAAHVRGEGSDLVLLPEMPFSRWLARDPHARESAWGDAVRMHEAWLQRLPELGATWVAGTRPVLEGGRPLNQAFVWSEKAGCVAIHEKVYLPNEEGFWEATWYDPGPPEFDLARLTEGGGVERVPARRAQPRATEIEDESGSAGVLVGFLVCTELWFTRHARDYMGQGVHLLLCPRATYRPSTDKWVAGGRAAATVSGAFCLSANFAGRASNEEPTAESPRREGGARWGGAGWVIDPEEADVLGLTDEGAPHITLDLDLIRADHAKNTYPRYVLDPT
jgi:N-carbamoylputrescine amidase